MKEGSKRAESLRGELRDIVGSYFIQRSAKHVRPAEVRRELLEGRRVMKAAARWFDRLSPATHQELAAKSLARADALGEDWVARYPRRGDEDETVRARALDQFYADSEASRRWHDVIELCLHHFQNDKGGIIGDIRDHMIVLLINVYERYTGKRAKGTIIYDSEGYRGPFLDLVVEMLRIAEQNPQISNNELGARTRRVLDRYHQEACEFEEAWVDPTG